MSWTKPTKSAIFSSPCVDNNCVYICTLSGEVNAYDLESGSIQWSYKVGKPIFSSPVCTRTGLCVGSVDHYIYHLSFTGELVSICFISIELLAMQSYTCMMRHNIFWTIVWSQGLIFVEKHL